MTKAVQKIQINPSCDIAFDKLVLSQANAPDQDRPLDRRPRRRYRPRRPVAEFACTPRTRRRRRTDWARGFVRPEDESGPGDASDRDSAAATEGARAGAPNVPVEGEAPNDVDEDALAPLPERLVAELTAFRTLALREALAQNPEIAFIVLLHRLCSDLFYGVQSGCLDASVRRAGFGAQVLHEIIAWKLRMFVPIGEAGHDALTHVLKRWPIDRICQIGG
jgi:hypothetical protein